MEDKKQDVNYLEELSKTADALQKCIVVFGNELSRALDYIKALKKEEDTWEMKCPLKKLDEYWFISDEGYTETGIWIDEYQDVRRFRQGNIFPTQQAAELEAKRRKLLKRFRAFRDECNGDWKPDFTICDNKYFIEKRSGKIDVNYICTVNAFILFGYFKNYEDAERAIELFGDEIKTLFVDCEGD